MGAARTRRDLLKDVGVAAGALAVLGCRTDGGQAIAAGAPELPVNGGVAPYVLPPLPYAYDALAPYIDARTLRLHHDAHHAGYVKGLNAAIDKMAAAERSDDVSMVKYWAGDIAFNGAGDMLHTLYWANMTPGGGGAPNGPVAEMIKASFQSPGAFAKVFAAVSISVPGSGWGVLAYEPLGRRLLVTGVQKHENVDIPGAVPLLVLDVWEHAYYLQYQNRRGEYVKAFMEHLVDWKTVNRRLEAVVR